MPFPRSAVLDLNRTLLQLGSSPPIRLEDLPQELYLMIIEPLVYNIGLYKSLRLRTVNRRFNAAILHTVCSVKTLAYFSEHLDRTWFKSMAPSLKAEVFLRGSYSDAASRTRIFGAINRVSTELADLTKAGEGEAREIRRKVALAAAQVGNHLESALYPKDRNVCEDTKRQNLICGAIIIGNLPLLDRLFDQLRNYVGVNKKSKYFGRPLHVAAAWGHLDIVQYLLDKGADPHLIAGATINDRDWHPDRADICIWSRHVYQSPDGSALRAAALSGHEDIVRLLLRPKCNILFSSAPEYIRAILAATRGGHAEIIDLLLEAAELDVGRLDDFRDQMLFEAVRHDRVQLVEWLLDAGTDVNARPKYLPRRTHGTALHIAAAHNRTGLIELLLERGASMRATCPKGFWPIETAAHNGHREAIDIMAERGGHLPRAFFSAIYAGQYYLVRSLLQDGRIDLQQKLRETSFEGLTIGEESLVQALLVNDATMFSFLLTVGAHRLRSPPPVGTSREWRHRPLYWRKELLRPQAPNPLVCRTTTCLENGETRDYLRWDLGPGWPYDQIERWGVRISNRTWNWVGKY